MASYFNDVNLATGRFHRVFFNQITRQSVDVIDKKIEEILENEGAYVLLDDKKYANIRLQGMSFKSNIMISFFAGDAPICTCGIVGLSRNAPELWDTMIGPALGFGQGAGMERPPSPFCATFFYPEASLFKDVTMLTGELVQILSVAWMGRYKKLPLIQ